MRREFDRWRRGVARVMRDLSAMDHGFGGGAAGVDASAAEMAFFNQRHSPAMIGQTMRKRIPRLAGPDNDGIVFHRQPSPGARSRSQISSNAFGSLFPKPNLGSSQQRKADEAAYQEFFAFIFDLHFDAVDLASFGIQYFSTLILIALLCQSP